MTGLALRGHGHASARAGLIGSIEHDLRRLAPVVLAGAISGFVMGGIGSRLAMMLIAALNRHATGLLTDDRAVIGRFDLGATVGLVLFTTILGVLGGLVFLAVRDLRVGATWFRTASIIVGPAVVVGSLLVHRDGMDYTVLQPAGLSIALFVAVPAAYASLLVWLGDRWLEEDRWPTQRPAWQVLPLTVPTLVFLPVAVPLISAWAIRRAIISYGPSRRLWEHPARAWAARIALAVVFAFASWNLASETIDLVIR